MNIVSSKEKLSKELKIESEKYYCVYYDTGWFIGRVLHDNIEQNTCKIKFLCANLNEFRWPKKDDVQEIDKKERDQKWPVLGHAHFETNFMPND